MTAYVRDLLGEVGRKNGWTLAEETGKGGPEGMHRAVELLLLGLRDDAREFVTEAIGNADTGVLIGDKSTFRRREFARPVWPASTPEPRDGSKTPPRNTPCLCPRAGRGDVRTRAVASEGLTAD